MASTISQWVLCFGSTQNNQLQCFFLFLNKGHKIGWTPNIEGDKFWNNKSLARDRQNKEIRNVTKRSIQIKITLNTHMIHDNYTIIKLQQNPKTHKPKNKTAPTFNKKKPFFFFKIRSTMQNHL
jgi:hypothetical protein